MSISVHFGSLSQNVLKLILKSPRSVPFVANSEPSLTARLSVITWHGDLDVWVGETCSCTGVSSSQSLSPHCWCLVFVTSTYQLQWHNWLTRDLHIWLHMIGLNCYLSVISVFKWLLCWRISTHSLVSTRSPDLSWDNHSVTLYINQQHLRISTFKSDIDLNVSKREIRT